MTYSKHLFFARLFGRLANLSFRSPSWEKRIFFTVRNGELVHLGDFVGRKTSFFRISGPTIIGLESKDSFAFYPQSNRVNLIFVSLFRGVRSLSIGYECFPHPIFESLSVKHYAAIGVEKGVLQRLDEYKESIEHPISEFLLQCAFKLTSNFLKQSKKQ